MISKKSPAQVSSSTDDVLTECISKGNSGDCSDGLVSSAPEIATVEPISSTNGASQSGVQSERVTSTSDACMAQLAEGLPVTSASDVTGGETLVKHVTSVSGLANSRISSESTTSTSSSIGGHFSVEHVTTVSGTSNRPFSNERAAATFKDIGGEFSVQHVITVNGVSERQISSEQTVSASGVICGEHSATQSTFTSRTTNRRCEDECVTSTLSNFGSGFSVKHVSSIQVDKDGKVLRSHFTSTLEDTARAISSESAAQTHSHMSASSSGVEENDTSVVKRLNTSTSVNNTSTDDRLPNDRVALKDASTNTEYSGGNNELGQTSSGSSTEAWGNNVHSDVNSNVDKDTLEENLLSPKPVATLKDKRTCREFVGEAYVLGEGDMHTDIIKSENTTPKHNAIKDNGFSKEVTIAEYTTPESLDREGTVSNNVKPDVNPNFDKDALDENLLTPKPVAPLKYKGTCREFVGEAFVLGEGDMQIDIAKSENTTLKNNAMTEKDLSKEVTSAECTSPESLDREATVTVLSVESLHEDLTPTGEIVAEKSLDQNVAPFGKFISADRLHGEVASLQGSKTTEDVDETTTRTRTEDIFMAEKVDEETAPAKPPTFKGLEENAAATAAAISDALTRVTNCLRSVHYPDTKITSNATAGLASGDRTFQSIAAQIVNDGTTEEGKNVVSLFDDVSEVLNPKERLQQLNVSPVPRGDTTQTESAFVGLSNTSDTSDSQRMTSDTKITSIVVGAGAGVAHDDTTSESITAYILNDSTTEEMKTAVFLTDEMSKMLATLGVSNPKEWLEQRMTSSVSHGDTQLESAFQGLSNTSNTSNTSDTSDSQRVTGAGSANKDNSDKRNIPWYLDPQRIDELTTPEFTDDETLSGALSDEEDMPYSKVNNAIYTTRRLVVAAAKFSQDEDTGGEPAVAGSPRQQAPPGDAEGASGETAEPSLSSSDRPSHQDAPTATALNIQFPRLNNLHVFGPVLRLGPTSMIRVGKKTPKDWFPTPNWLQTEEGNAWFQGLCTRVIAFYKSSQQNRETFSDSSITQNHATPRSSREATPVTAVSEDAKEDTSFVATRINEFSGRRRVARNNMAVGWASTSDREDAPNTWVTDVMCTMYYVYNAQIAFDKLEHMKHWHMCRDSILSRPLPERAHVLRLVRKDYTEALTGIRECQSTQRQMYGLQIPPELVSDVNGCHQKLLTLLSTLHIPESVCLLETCLQGGADFQLTIEPGGQSCT